MLDVLGLWRDDPQAVLLEMRDLVLRRYGIDVCLMLSLDINILH